MSAASHDAPATPHGEVDVSPARADEAAAVAQVCIDAYAALDYPLRPQYAAELADVAGRMADPAAVVLAARLDGRVVGHATVVLGPSPLADHLRPGESSLRMVAVAPSAQGRGVGRAMVDTALRLAREAGCGWMRLYTQPVMVAAQRMYEAAGFRRVPCRDADVLDGTLHLLAYEKELQPPAR